MAFRLTYLEYGKSIKCNSGCTGSVRFIAASQSSISVFHTKDPLRAPGRPWRPPACHAERFGNVFVVTTYTRTAFRRGLLRIPNTRINIELKEAGRGAERLAAPNAQRIQHRPLQGPSFQQGWVEQNANLGCGECANEGGTVAAAATTRGSGARVSENVRDGVQGAARGYASPTGDVARFASSSAGSVPVRDSRPVETSRVVTIQGEAPANCHLR